MHLVARCRLVGTWVSPRYGVSRQRPFRFVRAMNYTKSRTPKIIMNYCLPVGILRIPFYFFSRLSSIVAFVWRWKASIFLAFSIALVLRIHSFSARKFFLKLKWIRRTSQDLANFWCLSSISIIIILLLWHGEGSEQTLLYYYYYYEFRCAYSILCWFQSIFSKFSFWPRAFVLVRCVCMEMASRLF